jgi:hypothetical protein
MQTKLVSFSKINNLCIDVGFVIYLARMSEKEFLFEIDQNFVLEEKQIALNQFFEMIITIHRVSYYTF